MKTAREQLAEAHQRMTPTQIARHALDMAHVLETYEEAFQSMQKSSQALIGVARGAQNAATQLQVSIRQVQSLHAAGRKKAARDMLSEIAAIEVLPAHIPDVPIHGALAATWPDVFDPSDESLARYGNDG